MIKNHELSQLFPRGTKLPHIDAIKDTLKVIDIDGLKHDNQRYRINSMLTTHTLLPPQAPSE